MARLQDQNFEHQNVIVGRSAALRPIAPGRGALKIGSKDLKIDDLIEPLKIVALRGNVLQTFVDIKKSRVSDHPTIPSETRKGNHKSTLTAAVFGGVQLPGPVRKNNGCGDRYDHYECQVCRGMKNTKYWIGNGNDCLSDRRAV